MYEIEKRIILTINMTKTQIRHATDRQPLPPLYALRAFEAAARLGSFSQASRELSRHIRTIEVWFGRTLFVRRCPRGIPTLEAQQFALQLNEGFSCIEQACRAFTSTPGTLRLKTPTTLTSRWLLDALSTLQEKNDPPGVELASVWMDTDTVDFSREPFDCAVLLGRGECGPGTISRRLFGEWLVPVCAPALLERVRHSLSGCELIHPSPDRRDWRRWLEGAGRAGEADLNGGKVFDTLVQASMAAVSGYGVAIADLLLSRKAIADGLLALPFSEAVATGDSYCLVRPEPTPYGRLIDALHHHLQKHVPAAFPPGICLVNRPLS